MRGALLADMCVGVGVVAAVWVVRVRVVCWCCVSWWVRAPAPACTMTDSAVQAGVAQIRVKQGGKKV